MPRVYLDHNATAPVRPEATVAMLAALSEHWGNASSVHREGAAARAAVERARTQVASLAGVAAEHVTFTSGATESNNMVLQGALLGAERGELVTCASEHASVLEVCEFLRERGVGVRTLPVEGDGRLDPERFEASLGERTRLASVMWVNSETGVVQPIRALAEIARRHGVRFHTDAAQALGAVAPALEEAGVAFASFSAHKLGGPQGIGALYVARGEVLPPLVRGGAQERGVRAGTLNVPGIVGFGAACAAAQADRAQRERTLGAQRERLWTEIEKRIGGALRNGSAEHGVAHVLNVSFPGAPAELLVEALDLEGFAVAAGSACDSGSTEASHVLLAMGLPVERARSAIRISMGATTRPCDIDALLDVLPSVVARVRGAVA